MVIQFFANTFNVESRLTQTALGLFKPGFLTREYLAIRRVNYLSPIRVFVVLMFLLFLLLSLFGFDNLSFKIDSEDEGASKLKQQTIDRSVLLQAISVDNYINQQLSELEMLVEKREQPQEIIDHTMQTIQELKKGLALDLDKTINVTLFGSHNKIQESDLYQLSSDEIIAKYKINSVPDQLALRAFQRFTQDPGGFVKFLFGNMTWALFLNVLLMAGIFKIFYPKNQYAVHFVYHLHLQSFIFLTIILGMGFYLLFPSNWIVILLLLTIFTYIAISLHRVYPRHKFKTSLYFILFMPLAMISLFTATFVVMFISSMLF